ncbi:MAG TPA: sodium:proton exchanger [Acidimicrobiia bacterium]
MVAAPPRPVRRPGTAFALAVAAAAPGVFLHLAGLHPEPVTAAATFGLAVVGAAFMLAWAAEAAQVDISAGLALALLALVAVLPEYAVDFVFTWKAGKHPAEFAPDALANMTGGNQLLIGAGWSLVVLVGAYRIRQSRRGRELRNVRAAPASTEVELQRSNSVAIAFLLIATLYGLTLPLHRTLTLIDAAILVTVFVVYMVRVARAPAGTPHLVGPARTIGTMSTARRRAAVAALFGAAIVTILVCAEPFAESLVDTGRKFAIDDFVLISLIAPLASEAPELLIAGMFAWRLDADAGLGALVSSKVNQWTLLVGTLPIVFAISSGGLHGLPIDAVQREELFVTAAQSAFAVAVLANRRISVREAVILLGVWLAQLFTKLPLFESIHAEARIGIGVLYLAMAAVILWRQRAHLRPLLHDGLVVPVATLAAGSEPEAVDGVE